MELQYEHPCTALPLRLLFLGTDSALATAQTELKAALSFFSSCLVTFWVGAEVGITTGNCRSLFILPFQFCDALISVALLLLSEPEPVTTK